MRLTTEDEWIVMLLWQLHFAILLISFIPYSRSEVLYPALIDLQRSIDPSS
jgi:hypothetical protein